MKNVVAYALAVCIAIPAAAYAQTARGAGWAKEPTAIFGLHLGEALPSGGVPSCNDSREGSQLALCRTDTLGYGLPYLVGGFPIAVFREGMISGEDGIVSGLLITGDQTDYTEIRQILVERYGPPTRRLQTEVKTKAGATFRSERLLWIGKKVTLTLNERSGRMDQTSIQFLHNASAAKASRERDEKTKQDASKM